jgi:hypothetical protein
MMHGMFGWSWPRGRRQHPSHGGRAQVEPGTGQKLSDTQLPHGWAENFETAHHVGDKVGETVHRLAHLYQRRISSLIRRISSLSRAIRLEPGSAELAFPRAVVRASRARAMALTAAERTFWGQFLGTGRGGTVCLAMKVLLKKLEKLSCQVEDNARERLGLADIRVH